jgi:hypothetical protein
MPTRCILEIGPGFGHWTHFLKDLCNRLIVVDLSKFRDFLSKLRIIERKSHRRAFSMSAQRFADIASEAGLCYITQEIINWKTSPKRLIDCLSVFTSKGSIWERPNQLIRNDGFMREAAYLSKLTRLYGNGLSNKSRRSPYLQPSK